MFYSLLTLHLFIAFPDTATIIPFVPPGHRVLHVAEGDLNHEGRNDFILITDNHPLTGAEKDTTGEIRSLLIILRHKNGSLIQFLRNNKAILCRECGGAFGDPFSGISIRENEFSIYHYGGSSYRWSIDNVFEWSEKDQTWFLKKTVHSGFSIHDSEHTEEEKTVLPEFPVSIQNFKQDE